MHRIFGRIALEDLGKSLLDRNPTTYGARRQVDQREDVKLVRVRFREAVQDVTQATLLRLEPSPRMMRDQSYDTGWHALFLKPVRPVHGVESSNSNGIRVTDIM